MVFLEDLKMLLLNFSFAMIYIIHKMLVLLKSYTAVKYIRNLFRPKKKTKAIKDRIHKDIKNLFEHEEEQNYYQPVRLIDFCSNN